LIHACLLITVPFASISCFSTHFELLHALRTILPRYLFVHPSLLSKAIAAFRELGLPEENIYILEGEAEGRKSLEDLVEDVRSKQIQRVGVRSAKKDTLAFMLFSSGTSGLPKAVMISHGNVWFYLVSSAIATLTDMQVTGPPANPPTKVLGVFPFNHAAGCIVLCLGGVLGHLTTVILPKWDPRDAISAIQTYKVNIAPMVPTMLDQLVTLQQTFKADLSSLVSIGAGAAHVSPELGRKVKGVMGWLGFVGEAYGMTEAVCTVIQTPVPGSLGGRESIPGSCGILRPGMEAKIILPDSPSPSSINPSPTSSTLAKIGEVGELWLKGEMVTMGYYKDEKATRESFFEGEGDLDLDLRSRWYKTGDWFKVDENQNFYFVDRAKDTLKVSGAQVSPTEIEDFLLANPTRLIVDIAVVGVLPPSPPMTAGQFKQKGERTRKDERVPRAWIVLGEEGKKVGEEGVIRELDEWVKKGLSRYKWVKGGFEVVDQIPRSPNGKILRRVLRERYEAQFSERSKL